MFSALPSERACYAWREGQMFKQIRELPTLPAPPLPVPAGNEKVIWAVPKLIGSVQYLEQTSGGSMRHAVLKDIKQ